MEDDHALGAGLLAQAHAFLPGRMAPADVAPVLVVGVHAVVHHEVGARDEAEHVAIHAARHVLSIGDVAERASVVLDAIAGRAVGMIERRGAHGDALARVERFAGVEVAVLEGRAEHFGRHREQRRNHELGEHALERHRAAQVTGPEPEAVLRLEHRTEKRQAAHMVKMGVGEIDIAVDAPALERLAQIADAGAGVEQQELLAAAHFERRGIAAVARGARPGAGDRAAHAPEPDREGCPISHARPT